MDMNKEIKIGTRGSKLALWQAYYVEEKLKAAGCKTKIVIIETKGDKILDVSIAKIGSKGVFTEELEDQLISGDIDIAVHSAKDMQSSLPEGFELIAFMEREKVNDVLLSHKKVDIEDKNIVLGTSSTRRVATLKHYYPHVKTVEVRGNLQTRIRKMEEGVCDALLLAYAGVHRMGYDSMIAKELSLEEFIPAVGQGSVAIECHESLEEETKIIIKKVLNDEPSSIRLRAERAFLKKVEGGCSIPVFALANLEGEEVTIQGGIISLDGKKRILVSAKSPIHQPEEAGIELANKLFEKGGDKILAKIKSGKNS
jgi:hydroxymethylbilane synthase